MQCIWKINLFLIFFSLHRHTLITTQNEIELWVVCYVQVVSWVSSNFSNNTMEGNVSKRFTILCRTKSWKLYFRKFRICSSGTAEMFVLLCGVDEKDTFKQKMNTFTYGMCWLIDGALFLSDLKWVSVYSFSGIKWMDDNCFLGKKLTLETTFSLVGILMENYEGWLRWYWNYRNTYSGEWKVLVPNGPFIALRTILVKLLLCLMTNNRTRLLLIVTTHALTRSFELTSTLRLYTFVKLTHSPLLLRSITTSTFSLPFIID